MSRRLDAQHVRVEPASVQAVAAAAGDVGGGLSPTRSTSARGGRPSRSNAASKIAGSGLAAPTSSEMITSAKQSRTWPIPGAAAGRPSPLVMSARQGSHRARTTSRAVHQVAGAGEVPEVDGA